MTPEEIKDKAVKISERTMFAWPVVISVLFAGWMLNNTISQTNERLARIEERLAGFGQRLDRMEARNYTEEWK